MGNPQTTSGRVPDNRTREQAPLQPPQGTAPRTPSAGWGITLSGKPGYIVPPAPPPPGNWTSDEVVKKFKMCPAAQQLWTQLSLKSLLDNRPDVKVVRDSTDPNGKRLALTIQGQVSTTTREITLAPEQTLCEAVGVLGMELLNLRRMDDFQAIRRSASVGDASRDDFIRRNEQIEFDNVKKAFTLYEGCKRDCGCQGTASPHKAFGAMPDFDTYLKSLGSQHPETYGKEWDAHYKVAFETKHPPKPPGPSQPPGPSP